MPRHVLPIRAVAALGILLGGAAPAPAQTIVDNWASVAVPPPPALQPVTVNAKTTALLMLDFNKQACNSERRPRCIESIPRVRGLLDRARAAGLAVIYSLSGEATTADIAPQVAPEGGEPAVRSGPDKFLHTDLEKILADKGVRTVVIVGTAAQGAVLYTASEAAFRGLRVVVPVDGMSAELPYAEQYTAWQLANAPRVGAQTTLTRIDLIRE